MLYPPGLLQSQPILPISSYGVREILCICFAGSCVQISHGFFIARSGCLREVLKRSLCPSYQPELQPLKFLLHCPAVDYCHIGEMKSPFLPASFSRVSFRYIALEVVQPLYKFLSVVWSTPLKYCRLRHL